MGMLSEFKEFAVKGNVVDLAVGVIIGGAFGKIVSTLTDKIIMPPVGLLLGRVNFSQLRFVLQPSQLGPDGKEAVKEVAIEYGSFIQTVLDFAILAFVIFLMVKAINSLKRTTPPPPAAPAPPSPTEV
ncbi:large-conductance mechanosensitive channel protein MscL, partial [bacterium]